MPTAKKNGARDAAIESFTRPRGKALISLLRSQTIDVFAGRVPNDIRVSLESLRPRAPDGVKVAVDAIARTDDGYSVTVDAGQPPLMVYEAGAGGFHRTLGGGLCNLSQDLGVIMDALGDAPGMTPPLDYLTWEDAKDAFPGSSVAGQSRTSLIFQDDGFEKLILTERGPSYDPGSVDPWALEQAFYEDADGFVFIGQEPPSSEKFDAILARKRAHPALKIFWLVGGNQLKQMFTEHRKFLSVVDVVSMNLSEAAAFFCFEPLTRRHRDANELRVMYAREIGRRTLDLGANHVVITDGAKGASIARKARGGKVEFVYSPLIQENIIEVDRDVREDTGCGDSFAASIAAAFLNNPDGFKLNETANFAHHIAGIVYQRARPSLTSDDARYIAEARSKARESSAFVGKREVFDRTVCQIKPAALAPRGAAKRVLVLLMGGDPSDPTQPHVTGAAAAFAHLDDQSRAGDYPQGPLVRLVRRVSASPTAVGKSGVEHVTTEAFRTLVDGHDLAQGIGSWEGAAPNGVRRADLEGHEGVTLMRVSLLEALEILSSEEFAALFGDIKFWHFATEDVDQRLVWYVRKSGVSPEQSEELVRQALRDYVVAAMGPQCNFHSFGAMTLEDFEADMTEQLILRVNGLLDGLYRRR